MVVIYVALHKQYTEKISVSKKLDARMYVLWMESVVPDREVKHTRCSTDLVVCRDICIFPWDRADKLENGVTTLTGTYENRVDGWASDGVHRWVREKEDNRDN